MTRYHAMADLAPRDIVARAIDSELKRSGDEWVLLDITHRDPVWVRERFPTIYERCLSFGIDITRAAHSRGTGRALLLRRCTHRPSRRERHPESLRGGGGREHGTPRRQSPGFELAARGRGLCRRARQRSLCGGSRTCRSVRSTRPTWELFGATPSDEAVVITQNWDEIRRLMWNYVGIVRTRQTPRRARPAHHAPAGGDHRVLLERSPHLRPRGATKSLDYR